jgi:hypothetical protein
VSSSTPKWFAVLLAGMIASAPAKQQSNLEGYSTPDSILLKNGETISGIIVRNSADAVWIQEGYGISQHPKSEIIRIRNAADIGMEFTDTNTIGDLPSWRVMVNDIRNNDRITLLEQVPATAIDNGLYKNVPYLSFRVNELLEMNIYGDPDDPAAIEFGAYGRAAGKDEIRRALRAFLAGFLTSRKEVSAIYSLPFSGGEKCIGTLCVKIIPATAPDSYGGWWISLFNPGKLTSSRMSDASYVKVTKPPKEIIGRGGHLRRNTWSPSDLVNVFPIEAIDASGPVAIQGFKRDRFGEFQLIESDQKASR